MVQLQKLYRLQQKLHLWRKSKKVMVYIKKQREPKELTLFKKTQNCSFSDFSGNEKIAVYKSLIKEQYGLCAYCMCRIFFDNEIHRNIQIEHFIPQSDNDLGSIKSLDYKNMLGVCDGGISFKRINKDSGNENLSCDVYKGNKLLSLNPSIKDDFEKMKIYYSSNGRIHSKNEQFNIELDSVLNLNTPRLINERKIVKQKVIQYLNTHNKLSAAKKLELIAKLKTPVDELLTPFYDVAVYFIERIAN